MSLTDFLLARIEEDEPAAHDDPTPYSVSVSGFSGEETPLGMWGTRRVLAECEAKRQIITLLTAPVMAPMLRPDDPAPEERSGDLRARILRQLATPYSAHPDYRDEWRP